MIHGAIILIMISGCKLLKIQALDENFAPEPDRIHLQNGTLYIDGTFEESSAWTEIFIYPGYRFKAMDALITNFHLPESTLVMLVSAFAGREHVLHAYEEAVRERYRFFSFGDAMFIS